MTDFISQHPHLLPFIIFFGRILDVSFGTLRIIFVSKGKRNIAPLIGFFEVFIWIIIISQIFSQANDILAYLSYALGYACGTFIGMTIESKLAFGVLVYRIYTKENGNELVRMLNKNGFGATMMLGSGSVGKVDIVETIVGRKKTKKVENLIAEFDPKLFYMTEDVRDAKNGIFPQTQTLLSRWRPGK